VAESLTPGFEDLLGWKSNWGDAKIGVFGVGATGFAILDTLVELGSEPLALAEEIEGDIARIVNVLGVTPVVSPEEATLLEALQQFAPEILIVSPGVTPGHPVVEAARRAGAEIWSDIDFAWRVRDKNLDISPWVLISGETYSRRVAELAARLLTAGGIPSLVVGHHSPPLLDALRDPHHYGAVLVVVNDNQVGFLARGVGPRSPRVAVCVEEKSLHRHGALYDGVSHACLYRRGIGDTMAMVEDAEVIDGARAIGVGFDTPDKSDLGLVEGILVDRAFLDDRAHHALEVSTLDELVEAGWTIPEDLPVIVAAIGVARSFDVSPAVISGVLTLP